MKYFEIILVLLILPLMVFGQEKGSTKQINLYPDEYSELDDVSISSHQKDDFLYKVLERARLKYLKALLSIEKKDTAKAAENFEQAIDILNSIASYPNARTNLDFLELVKSILEDYETHIKNIDKLDENSSLSLIRESLNKEIEISLQNRKVNIGTIHPKNQLTISDTSTPVINFTIPMDNNEFVQKSIEFLTQKPIGRKFIKGSLARSGVWGRIVKKIIQEEGMPPEIFYLAMVESGFNPFAVSRAKAVGMWQFISSTGKLYNLNVGSSVWIDERRDPIKSTKAAMRHLKDLYNQLGDWHLAIAAYNCGINAVERAISRLNQTDSVNFWNIMQFLPRETRNYVPLFIATVKIASNPETFGFALDEIKPSKEIAFETFLLKEPVSLSALAKCAGVDIEILKELNPELIAPFTPPDVSEYELRIPFGTKNDFVARFITLKPEEKTPFYIYTVGKRESIRQISEKFNVDVDQILLANNLSISVKKLPKGTQLRIPILLTQSDSSTTARKANDNFAEATAFSTQAKLTDSNSQLPFSNQPISFGESRYKKIVFRYFVKKDETLKSIASKFKVEIDSIVAWNHLVSRNVQENQTLRIIVSEENIAEAQNTPETKSNADLPNPFLNKYSKKVKKIHKVKKGETLEIIANKYNVTISDLLNWNSALKKRKNFKILVGEKLVLYSNEIRSITDNNSSTVKIHIVRPGDTISSIARKYGIPFNELVRRNPKLDPNNIKIGQKVYLQ